MLLQSIQERKNPFNSVSHAQCILCFDLNIWWGERATRIMGEACRIIRHVGVLHESSQAMKLPRTLAHPPGCLLLTTLCTLFLLQFPRSTRSDFKQSSIFPVVNNNNNSLLDSLVTRAEEISISQSHASERAATEARQTLADLSWKWAKLAQLVSLQKANQVVHITRAAQDAQIFSLRTSSISTQLKSAALAATNTFEVAFQRYLTLSSLAKAAEIYSSAVAITLDRFLQILSTREKWALDEKERAWRLSKHLQFLLKELKQTSEFAREAEEAFRQMQAHGTLRSTGLPINYFS